MKQNALVSLLLLLLFLLLEFCNGDIYIIGYNDTLTWDYSNINSSRINISLFYGNNFQNNWTIATDVENTGTYWVDIPLNDSLIQFNIPNHSKGQFRAIYYVNNVEKEYNLSFPLTILQPVLLDTVHGRVTSRGNTIVVTVYVADVIYNKLDNIEFFAQYVTINEEKNTWVPHCNLNISTSTLAPTKKPTLAPTATPTPTSKPTVKPTGTTFPTGHPTDAPTNVPTSFTPTSPSRHPTDAPTRVPTSFAPTSPSRHPTDAPTHVPISVPTQSPTKTPTHAPTVNTPTLKPTTPIPSRLPTDAPTYAPTTVPTRNPTRLPTNAPTHLPTQAPTHQPTTRTPTKAPVTNTPTVKPITPSPTHLPSSAPTRVPTTFPTKTPTSFPTAYPTKVPTTFPTQIPTSVPTKLPTHLPTQLPTDAPTSLPTTPFPTRPPTTHAPSKAPTFVPTQLPTRMPTNVPTSLPTNAPTYVPTRFPTKVPTQVPTRVPTHLPTPSPTTASPTRPPTTRAPSRTPTHVPTHVPTTFPTKLPTNAPTTIPTTFPTNAPSGAPTDAPTLVPTVVPTHFPSGIPTKFPTHVPTTFPTDTPTHVPTDSPTQVPTHVPTRVPTQVPTHVPTHIPTSGPPTLSFAKDKRSLLKEEEKEKVTINDTNYYEFTLTITIPSVDACDAGGPYLLNVGLRNSNTTKRYYYQYYAINALNNSNDVAYKFVNYNPSTLKINVTVNNRTTLTDLSSRIIYNFSKYDDVKLSLSIDEQINNLQYYVGLKSFVGEYELACESQHLSQFTSFGWKTWNANATDISPSFLPYATYELQIFWAANQSWEHILVNRAYYEMTPANITYLTIDASKATYPAVRVADKNALSFNQGSNALITFETSFNKTQVLYAYFEQCHNSKDQKPQCVKYQNETKSFTYDSYENQKPTTLPTPNSLLISDSGDNVTTYLHVYSYNCRNNGTIETIIPVNVTKAGSKNNSKLSTGAIVGIVCAVVLVIGLVAWWISMKIKKDKDNTAEYRSLEQQN